MGIYDDHNRLMVAMTFNNDVGDSWELADDPRYPERFSADDIATISRGIDNRLRQIERLYQTPLNNADEPDFVYSVYRGAD